ncbi:MAG: hypothetical protein R2854_11890 [Caldilineaceae bacterium]
MSELKQLTVPVLGMTAPTVWPRSGNNARKVSAVDKADVNYASEKLTFEYDPAVTTSATCWTR